MIKNKIPIVFGGLTRVIGPAINYQYDAVQFLVICDLELPVAYEVDFCNEGDAQTITMPNTADGVQIPDEFLLTGKQIKAYIVVTGDDEGAVETRYEITIPVRARPQRTDIEPTPAEQQQIDQLIAALSDGVSRAETAAEGAEGSETAAGESAVLAESWAVGGTGSRTGEDQNNAYYWSEIAKESASEQGWVHFYIDDQGILHYVKTENAALDFYIDSAGVLHVTN